MLANRAGSEGSCAAKSAAMGGGSAVEVEAEVEEDAIGAGAGPGGRGRPKGFPKIPRAAMLRHSSRVGRSRVDGRLVCMSGAMSGVAYELDACAFTACDEADEAEIGRVEGGTRAMALMVMHGVSCRITGSSGELLRGWEMACTGNLSLPVSVSLGAESGPGIRIVQRG